MHYNFHNEICPQLAAEHVGEKIMKKVYHNTVVHFVSVMHRGALRERDGLTFV